MAGKEADAKRHQTTKPHLPASKLLCLANPMMKPQCGMTFSKKRQICWGNHCDKVGITISSYATVKVKIYWIRVTLDGFYTKSISEQIFLRLLFEFCSSKEL